MLVISSEVYTEKVLFSEDICVTVTISVSPLVSDVTRNCLR